MAGDVGIEERAIVLGTGTGRAAADVGVFLRQVRGRVQHHYGPRVVIGEVTEEAKEAVRAVVPEGEVAASPAALSADVQSDLDEAGVVGLRALSLRQSDEYAQAKAQRPLAGESWDVYPDSAPDHDLSPEAGTASVDAGAPAPESGPTSDRLIDSVAVGIVIVSGPGNLAFSSSEETKIVAEVQNGLSWLAGQNHGGNVSWHYDIQSVTITTPANSSAPSKEALWRNPAMIKLGYSGNWQGVIDYVQHLRSSMGTQWAYCGYFTKYPLNHFAYASLGGPRLVMQYENDGWGPDNIDRVFAHETGHIFTAPDEYATSDCNCGGKWGVFKQPNGNCANCAPSGGVSCIMRTNDWAMCHYTPWHLGFRWPDGNTINIRDSTPRSPAASAFDDKLFVLWKANDSSNQIYCSSSADGLSWPNGQTINGVDSTPEAPAVAVFDDKLYAFWKANDRWDRIYYSASSDGQGWPNGETINGTDSTPKALAAAVFKDKLHLFWKANDRWNRIYYSASSDGKTWPNGKTINGIDSTPEALAAAVFDGKLYLFWKANDSLNRIFYSASSDGKTWPNGKTINGIDSTHEALAAAVFDGKLYLFWKASGSSNRIFYSASSDGQSWPNGQTINDRNSTPLAPAATVFHDNPYLFWKANDSSNRIVFSP